MSIPAHAVAAGALLVLGLAYSLQSCTLTSRPSSRNTVASELSGSYTTATASPTPSWTAWPRGSTGPDSELQLGGQLHGSLRFHDGSPPLLDGRLVGSAQPIPGDALAPTVEVYLLLHGKPLDAETNTTFLIRAELVVSGIEERNGVQTSWIWSRGLIGKLEQVFPIPGSLQWMLELTELDGAPTGSWTLAKN